MDFNLPKEYLKNKTLAKSNFMKSLPAKDRQRFDESVKGIFLDYQMEGENIPSIVNETYNVQVIMFINAKIDNIKNTAFIASIMQEKLKAFAIMIFTDNAENCVLSFALKRLSELDKNEIVITDRFLSETYNQTLSSQFGDDIHLYLAYDKILNRNNKYCFYFEVAAKCFILSNKYLYKDYLKIVNSKLWYNHDKAFKVYENFKQLDYKKRELKQVTEIQEQIRLNGDIKELIQELEKYE